jgi:hypothetical protein
MTIDDTKPWPFPHVTLQGDSSLKALADTLAMLEDFTAFQLRGDIYYGYPDKKALKTIEGLRNTLGQGKTINEVYGGGSEA